MYNTFSTEARTVLRHYHCSTSVPRKLALRNLDILDSIPITDRGRDHAIAQEDITQSPRSHKDLAYVDAKSTKLPTRILSYSKSQLGSQGRRRATPSRRQSPFRSQLRLDSSVRRAPAYFRYYLMDNCTVASQREYAYCNG